MFRYLYIALFVVCFYLPSNSAFAVRTIHESFMSQESSKKELVGEFAGGQFGSSMTKGDFNRDGIEDLVISAPIASPKDKNWSGAVRVMFGGTYNIVTYHGENSGDQLGRALAVGDFNGDGADDLAIGAHNAYVSGENPGKVYLVYGGNIEGNSRDFANEKADLELVGPLDKSGFGLALDSGDMNADGIADLYVGSPLFQYQGNPNVGAVYAYFGSDNGPEKQYSRVFFGQEREERFGSDIKNGDLNGDGYLDLVVSAYRADTKGQSQAGKVYYYNGTDYYKMFDPDISIEGVYNGGWFGFSLDIADINGDGTDDLAVSSFPYWHDHKISQVSIFYGGDRFKFDGGTMIGNDESVDLAISHPEGDNLLASDVILRDVNGDSKADVLLGAPGVSTVNESEGAVYLLETSSKDLDKKYNVKEKDLDSYIYGEFIDDWFGNSLEVLDFNGDGHQDLAVGAMYADSGEITDNGKVFVLWGDGGSFGKQKNVSEVNRNEVSRGEFVREILTKFDLREKKKSEISNCHNYREFCLFNFMSMSSYNEIQLEPQLILYPDIRLGDEYYEDITTATLLGLVNGYIDVKDSPFNKDLPISRIQALKVIMGATDLVPAKYRFELIASLGSYDKLISQESYFTDVDAKIDHMWWYPRYVNFAVDQGLVDEGEFFRPDEFISKDELNELIERTVEFINSENAEVKS